MRLMTGLLAGQAFDSELIGDSSLMKRPMERAAAPLRKMGARIATARWSAAGADHRRLATVGHSLRSARCERAGEIGGVAGWACTRVVTTDGGRARGYARSHRAHAARARRAVDAARGHVKLDPSAAICKPVRSRCRAIFPRRRSLWLPARSRSGPGLTIEGVGINPTRTGLLDILALMGADLRFVRHRSAGAEPVADIEVRPAQLRASTFRRISCRWRSMSSRRCSSPPRARREKPSSRAPRNCESRKAIVLRSWPKDCARWASSAMCCSTACAVQGTGRRSRVLSRTRRQPRRSSHRDVLRRREPARPWRRSRSST